MLDILFLVGAIAMLVVLQILRNLLSLVFSRVQVHRVDIAKAPEGAADLYAEAHAELVALGFSGPQWYLGRVSADVEESTHLQAVYVHAGGSQCRLHPPVVLDRPNRLTVAWITRLADGRFVISQPYDPFFELIATPGFPARMIAGETFSEQWNTHQQFVASFDSPPDPAGADAEAISAFNEEVYAGTRQRLVDERKGWIDSRGWVRPTLGFAWRIFRLVRRRPKFAPSAATVPPARLAALAVSMRRIGERPAPARVQAALFAVSVALFLALGAVFWSPAMAVILLVVIAIHELGHYVAMRAFGYRNVQMLALPLVGGVTIGHEVKPDAARRAWMSLAGPLPGVLIGWAMLLAMPHVEVPSWWMTTAWVFLGLNYLNVLPVPPLDGGHVVQALLPVRAAKLQAVFIVVACVVGAIGAWQFGLTLIAFLALFQLTLASSHWQLARLLDRARGDAGLDPARARVLRLRRLFEIADEVAGPTPKAAPRITQATSALMALDVAPMRWSQRAVIGTVYTALLAGPVLAATMLWSFTRSMPDKADMAARTAQLEQEQRQFSSRASELDLSVLLADTSDDEVGPTAPASEEAIASTQARLGIVLPAELLTLYRMHDGIPFLAIGPVASLVRWSDATDGSLDEAAPRGSIEVTVFSDDGKYDTTTHVVTRARAGAWLVLASGQDGAMHRLYDAGDPPAVPGLRVFQVGGTFVSGEATLRSGFEARWVANQQAREIGRRVDERAASLEREYADEPLSALMARVPRPSLAERLLGASALGPSSAASASDIVQAEQRIGATLAADLREFLALHDGVPILQLHAVANYRRIDLADASLRELLSFDLKSRDATKLLPANWLVTVEDFAGCIEVGGVKGGRRPGLLWCPALDASRRYVDLFTQRTFPTLPDYLRAWIARREAMRFE